MIAIITYKNGIKVTIKQLTEIHYGYDTSMPGTQIAFESNIKQTGFTKSIKDIKEIEIFD